MKNNLPALAISLAVTGGISITIAQTRTPPPTRDPHTAGYVQATELPDGAVPSIAAEGNFILGPTHSPAPEITVNDAVPHGTVSTFTMSSADSKIYPGIAREGSTTVDPSDATKVIVNSHPAPYTRQVAVYVPQQYVRGTVAPFIVGADGPDPMLFAALDNLIAQKRVPAMIAISIGNGSGDAQGSERGHEYDTMSGRYAEFVETEVLPLVEKQYNVKLTKDPDGRATMGGSSGGSAALEMAWYHNDLYHRVLTYSGTYVNQQWPYDPATPHGAWEFHEHLIPDSPVKPIRIWMEVGDRDNLNTRDNYHDWVLANEKMAAVLAAKHYHYQFLFARNAGHTDKAVKQQTLPEALEWVWKGYQAQASDAQVAMPPGAGAAQLQRVEGKPIDTRPTEMKGNTPAFPEQTRAPYHATAPFDVTTIVDNMHVPWSLAFLPDGNMLVTQRLPGSIHIIDKKGALAAPLAGVSSVKDPNATDIGVLDVAVDPNFSRTHRLFFTFFDYIDGTNTNTNVARARLDETNNAVTDVTVIFRAQPSRPSKRLGAKTGGRIVIAPDGTLFLPIGDRSDSPPWNVAQQMDSDLGKIIHITADGAPARDNPFIGKPGVLPEIWASGTRSQEGLAFDPKTGRLWEHEHGPRGGDELNIIEKGKNYGWPVIVHGIDYPGNLIGEGITHKAGMEEPVYYWDPVIGPSGLAFYKGDLFPQWKNSLFVGALRGAMLDRLEIVNDKVVAEEPLLTDLHTRIRDVRVGPDGAVYVLTDSGTPTMSPDTPATSRLVKLTPRAK